MRKRAQGTAPSEPVPTPPPPPKPTQPDKPKRPCLNCNQTITNTVTVDGQQRSIEAFCSLICGFDWAQRVIIDSRIDWCDQHKTWTDLKGRCLGCKLKKEGYPKSLIKDSLAREERRKAVPHV